MGDQKREVPLYKKKLIAQNLLDHLPDAPSFRSDKFSMPDASGSGVVHLGAKPRT
jgi:hypothetical protein